MTRTLYTLLVGIDTYSASVAPLRGCVNDIERMKTLLDVRVVQPELLRHCVLLNQAATRQAVIDSFRNHLGQAGKDDIVLFYFCGYGSQAVSPPEFAQLEPDGLDETVVCYDSRMPGGWDLADKELAQLVAEVAATAGHVAVILDCSHSGSGTRGVAPAEVGVRRLSTDLRLRPIETFLVSPQHATMLAQAEIGDAWRGGGWFTMPYGRHILLSACRPDEEALELNLDGEYHGVFSHFLFETLSQFDKNLSYRDLFQRVSARVRSTVANQTPQLDASEPNGRNELFLGSIMTAGPPYFTLSYDAQRGWLMDGGLAHGFTAPEGQETTTFAIFPFDAQAPQLTTPSVAIGEARVLRTHATYSEVAITLSDGSTLATDTTYKVQVAATTFPLRPLIVAFEGDSAALTLVREILATTTYDGQSQLTVREGERKQATLLLLAADNRYQIRRISDVYPLLVDTPGFDESSAHLIVQRLQHIARWQNVVALANPLSNIAQDAIRLELLLPDPDGQWRPATFDAEARLEYRRIDGAWQQPQFKLRLLNTSTQRLYCALFDLPETYGVFPMFRHGGTWLSPGEEFWVNDGEPFYAAVPQPLWQQGVVEFRDILKLIVSTREFNATLLEQDDLPVAITRDLGRGGRFIRPANTLERIIQRTQGHPPQSLSGSEPIADWSTAELQFVTVRPRDVISITPPEPQVQLGHGVTLLNQSALHASARLTSLSEANRAAGKALPSELLREHTEITQPLALASGHGGELGLSVIELMNVTDPTVVTPLQPLVLKLDTALTGDEAVLVVGYDNTGFLPVGRSHVSTSGTEIRVERLPEPIPGVGNAKVVRLYFFKADSTEHLLKSAESLLKQVLSVQETTLGNNHPLVAARLSALGEIYLASGRFSDAATATQRALAIQQRPGDDQQPETITSKYTLAKAFVGLGRYLEGRQLLEQVVEAMRVTVGTEHRQYMSVLTALTRLYGAMGLAEQTFKAMRQLMEAENTQLTRCFTGRNDERVAEFVQTATDNLEIVLSLVCNQLSHSPSAVQEAFEMVLRRKGLKMVAVAAQAAATGQCAEVARWQNAQLEQVAAALPAGSVLVEFVRVRNYDFKQKPMTKPIQWTTSRYLVFVLLAQNPDALHLVDLGDAKRLEEMITDYIQALDQQKRERRSTLAAALSLEKSAQILHLALIEPLRPLLGNRRHLILAPDGAFVRLSFATLLTQEGKYLLEDYHFSYLLCGRWALAVTEPAPTDTAPFTESIVMGDPDFDLQQRTASRALLKADSKMVEHNRGELQTSFARLPGTRTEAREVASILGVTPRLGDRALKTTLKTMASPRFLHLAIPGFFRSAPTEISPANAQDLPAEMQDIEMDLSQAGLTLAGANTWLHGAQPPDEAEDGFLRLDEIARLNLVQTELVTLSACTTASAAPAFTQDLAWLQWAFLNAGAKRLVMNLWPAPDQQTIALMVNFYRHSLSQQSHAQALRNVQLAMKQEFPSPLFWGAFVCYGDLTPLPLVVEYKEAVSPYQVGAPVQGELFVGRQDILKKIEDNLAVAAGKNILVLRGQRRTGKTSVLYRLRDTFFKNSQGRYLPVFASVQGLMGVKDESAFYWRLARQIADGLQRNGLQITPPTLLDFQGDPPGIFEFDFLPSVFHALGNSRLLLMLDEFDMIQQLIEQKVLPKEVLDFIRYLMQSKPALLFLLAGTQKLREFTGGYWSVFFNLTVPIDISTLEERDARRLITEPMRQFYQFETEAVNQLVDITGCHPYFIQVLCDQLVQVRNRYSLTVVAPTYVEEAVLGALQSVGENIGYPWSEADCTEQERLVLGILAAQAQSQAAVSLQVIQQELEQAGVKVALTATVQRLLNRGVIHYRQTQSEITFVMPLFQRWLIYNKYDSLAAAVKYNQEHPLPTSQGGGSNG